MTDTKQQRSPSYRPCDWFGRSEDCQFAKDGEPCWGEVTIVDDYNDETETEESFYLCQGHGRKLYEYVPEESGS